VENHTVVETAKKVLDALYRDLDRLEVAEGVKGLRKAVTVEMAKYLIYLTESDGRIKWAEARILSEFLDLDMQPEDIYDFLDDKDHYAEEFEQGLPLLFQKTVELDNKIFALGGRETTCASEWMLAAYKCLGISLVEADGEVSKEENEKIRAYIKKMEEYLEERLLPGIVKKWVKRRAGDE